MDGRTGEGDVSIGGTGGGCVAWFSGGGVGCGGFQAGSVGVVMCTLVGGVTCVVGLSADLLRLRIQGEYVDGVTSIGTPPSCSIQE